MKILLVNPPIYDFAAYDFWLRPYGLLQVGGFLASRSKVFLFDYLDRYCWENSVASLRSDRWGRGRFPAHVVSRPPVYGRIRRRYRRYGRPRSEFLEFLEKHGPFDLALTGTGMTYWYLGIREVLADLKGTLPGCRTVLGGTYATLCPEHASSLGADLVISGRRLDRLWDFAGVVPDLEALPFWQGYRRPDPAVLKLTDGCPFRCTYCSVPVVCPEFQPRPLDRSLAELEWALACGARNIVFYDDALLYQPALVLEPFLETVLARGLSPAFHTPNALNARFLTPELARLMVAAGFKTFYLGLESESREWHRRSGRKVYAGEFERAVRNLVDAGAPSSEICAYVLLGHPRSSAREVEDSLRFVQSLGVLSMLAEFSPIPGTPDGELCHRFVDLDEPLWHNNTLFPILLLGEKEVLRLKDLCRELNADR
ncbi:MAG: radical SAM protein [Acidobacteriota bacterium]